jgi:hypothetical protein
VTYDQGSVQILIEMLARDLVHKQASRTGFLPFYTNRVKNTLLCAYVCLVHPLIEVCFKGVKQRTQVKSLRVLTVNQSCGNAGENVIPTMNPYQTANISSSTDKQV